MALARDLFNQSTRSDPESFSFCGEDGDRAGHLSLAILGCTTPHSLSRGLPVWCIVRRRSYSRARSPRPSFRPVSRWVEKEVRFF